jgi:DNA repair protein RadD
MQDLRDYQAQSIRSIQAAWGSHPSVLLVAPTGSGKTTILAHLLRQVRGKVLVLCPWLSLVTQSRDRLLEHDLDVGVMLGKRRPDTRITVTTIPTAARRDLSDGGYDVIVIDEAHRSLAPQCSAIMQAHPRAKLLGLTATPVRLDGKLLSTAYAKTIVSCTHAELIRRGYLVPHTVYGCPEEIDVSSLPIDRRTHDFQTAALARASMTPKLLADAVQEYTRLGQWKPAFVYCVNIPHGQAVLEHYKKAGISAELVTGETAPSVRREMLQRLQDGASKILVNCAVLTEGVDAPFVEVLQVLRSTASVGLHLQIIGRGSRPAPGKSTCIILDHAGNFRRHGFSEDERDWEAEAEAQLKTTRRTERKRPPRARTCPGCRRLVPAHVSRCPHCGYVFTPVTGKGKLERLVPGSIRRRTRRPLV